METSTGQKYRPTSPTYSPTDFETVTEKTTEVKKQLPPEVAADNDSGVETRSLELARLFMGKHGRLARNCRTRGDLAALYISTQATWMPEHWAADINEQRLVKQVLFAIAHGMKLVRVVNRGRNLKWNRYRDNEGNPIEREEHKPRRDDRRGRRDIDRRDRRRDYDRRDRRDRDYDRRHPSSYREEEWCWNDSRDFVPTERSVAGSKHNRKHNRSRSPSTEKVEPIDLNYSREDRSNWADM